MTLAERLSEYVRAAFSGIYVRSYEHDDAIAEIARLCRDQGWSLATWDVDRGLAIAGRAEGPGVVPGAADPLAAIRSLPALATPEGTAILVLRNFHRYLGSPEIAQALDTQLAAGKQSRTFLVILAPVVQVPVELEKLFVVIEHDLPDREQLGAIARGVATEPGELPGGDDLDGVLDAAAGLTRLEAENAFSLSLVRHGRLAPEVLWEIKAGMLKKLGLLTMHRGGETFADLGGLDALKAFCSRALRPGRPEGVRAKGMLLLGPPGSGKSAMAKALGAETGRPTLILDVGTLLGSLVGQSEANIRQALRLVDAMSPCVVMVDEVEKALAGSSGSSGDSGVSARLFGTLLSWLNDRTSDSFVVCTANDISRLPPEFARSERFDATFFLDLPGPEEKRAIWRMYREKYQLDPAGPLPQDRDWTPAEVKACCRLAALLEVSLVEAARNIVPVAVTAGESVELLRQWAAGRCLSADRPGLYTRATEAAIKPGRNVRRDPSSN
jgi:adenylylsulfate kinase-like enzyme